MYGTRPSVPVFCSALLSRRNLEGQARGDDGPAAVAAIERPLRPNVNLRETRLTLNIVRWIIRMQRYKAEFVHHDRPTIGQGDACLETEEIAMTAIEHRVIVRRLLVDEDGPHFRQRTRIFKVERIADRRNHLVESVIALERTAFAGPFAVLPEPSVGTGSDGAPIGAVVSRGRRVWAAPGGGGGGGGGGPSGACVRIMRLSDHDSGIVSASIDGNGGRFDEESASSSAMGHPARPRDRTAVLGLSSAW